MPGRTVYSRSTWRKRISHTIKEIGWFEVKKVSSHKLTDNLPEAFTTFHWHGDTFTLPDGAVHLFKTKSCIQQGFVYNNHVAALQFHMEVKEDLLNGMTEHERGALVKDAYVQTENEIRQLTPAYINLQKKYLYNFMQAFTSI